MKIISFTAILALAFSFNAYGDSSFVSQINRCVEKSNKISLLLESYQDSRETGTNMISSGAATVALGGAMFSSGAAFLVIGPYVALTGAGASSLGGGVLLFSPMSEVEALEAAQYLYEMEKNIALDLVDGESSSITMDYLRLCKEKVLTSQVELCGSIEKGIKKNLESGSLCEADYLELIKSQVN